MIFDKKKRRAIFVKNDGQCHICCKKLVFSNYGIVESKGARSTISARRKNGFREAPLSNSEMESNALVGGLGSALVGRVLLSSFGPIGVVAGAVI